MKFLCRISILVITVVSWKAELCYNPFSRLLWWLRVLVGSSCQVGWKWVHKSWGWEWCSCDCLFKLCAAFFTFYKRRCCDSGFLSISFLPKRSSPTVGSTFVRSKWRERTYAHKVDSKDIRYNAVTRYKYRSVGRSNRRFPIIYLSVSYIGQSLLSDREGTTFAR